MRLRDAFCTDSLTPLSHVIILCLTCWYEGCSLLLSVAPSCPAYVGLLLMACSLLHSPLQIIHDNYILYVFAPNRESRQRWVFTLKEGIKTPVLTNVEVTYPRPVFLETVMQRKYARRVKVLDLSMQTDIGEWDYNIKLLVCLQQQ